MYTARSIASAKFLEKCPLDLIAAETLRGLSKRPAKRNRGPFQLTVLFFKALQHLQKLKELLLCTSFSGLVAPSLGGYLDSTVARDRLPPNGTERGIGQDRRTESTGESYLSG